MKSSGVSIIVPVFNRGNLISDTIRSVQYQTNSSWELILIDDGSTDDSVKIMDAFVKADKRIKLINRDRLPKGSNTCRNIGLMSSSFENVIFLDSDDLLAPWCIEERLETANTKRYDLIVSQVAEFNNSDLQNRRLRTLYGVQSPLALLKEFEIPWGTPGVLWSKKFLLTIGGWDEEALVWQDVELHFRALLSNPKLVWGSEIPDVFVRVETNYDKISNSFSKAKTISNLGYLFSKISGNLPSKERNKFNFLCKVFLTNKSEMLPSSELRLLLESDWGITNNKLEMLLSKFYLRLLLQSREIKLIHSLLYRLRKIGIPTKRKKLTLQRPNMNKIQFEMLKQKAWNHKDLIGMVKFLN